MVIGEKNGIGCVSWGAIVINDWSLEKNVKFYTIFNNNANEWSVTGDNGDQWPVIQNNWSLGKMGVSGCLLEPVVMSDKSLETMVIINWLLKPTVVISDWLLWTMVVNVLVTGNNGAQFIGE